MDHATGNRSCGFNVPVPVSQGSSNGCKSLPEDIAMFCGGAPGPKQEMQCLEQNKDYLSPQCKMHIVQVLKAVKEALPDCRFPMENRSDSQKETCTWEGPHNATMRWSLRRTM